MIPSRISEIGFSILSPEVIKQLARVRVVNSDLYDADGYPVEGGVMDPRLGVIDPGLHCRTCGGSIGECPGHFGYLEMAKPIIHVLYTKVIYQLLKFTCKKCNRIMVKEGKKMKAKAIAPLKCPHCKAKQKKISLVKPYTFYADKTELTPLDIRERFEKLSKKDLNVIGFKGGRPEWLILTLLPIPPVTMRPSITLETGERSEDDLTHKLVDIVRINQSLKENIDIGAPEFILADLWELIQYHCSTYFDNELTGAPLARHRSGRPLKGLIQRMKAKEGRIRGNLLGKRVNFSARTVIIPDPNISINEVGVPEVIAKELTIPMQITEFNMKEIKDLIKMDRVNYVIRPDGRRIKVTSENKKDLLENIAVEWFIDRQLEDGDIVLFNRQPSLHRISMMAHRVKVMPDHSFRLNPSVCFPYNADFDGDEMNLHVPQTEEARTEASFLMEVHHNLISPRFGGPLIGCDLEQISGIYMLTDKNVKLTREETAQLLATANIDIDLPDKDSFTGKEIFSMLLPDSLNIEFGSKCGKGMTLDEKKKKDAWVVIKNGKLIEGRVDKAGVGIEDGKIIGKLCSTIDSERVKEFIDDCGRLGSQYLVLRGFSLGISDLDLPAKSLKDVKKELDDAQKEANELVKNYREGKIKVLPGMTPRESLEAQVLNCLASGISRISDIVTSTIPKTSDMISMANAGAKGSMINITQMSAGVGQETISGHRIERGYLNRTLSHMRRNDLSPMAKGFVARGFKQGLTPFELFWNIMNGREGLMDKSLRTRKSGYMQRRLVNALQDLQVKKDGSVRNSVGEIIQFKAGEDGIDPSKSDFGKLDWKDVLRKCEEQKGKPAAGEKK
ncbi:MAG: DNA-directed RNA polymerase subunit A' [Candidatus Aenigmarchaeota archaeon]